MTRAALFIAVCLLAGCGTATTRDTQSGTERQERFTGSGSFGVPVAADTPSGRTIVPVPFDFDVSRTVTESTKESQQSKTKLEVPELAAAFSTALRTSFPQLGALIGAPAPSGGLSTTEITTLSGLGASALALIAQQIRNTKNAAEAARAKEEAAQQREQCEFHKDDAEKAYAMLLPKMGGPT